MIKQTISSLAMMALLTGTVDARGMSVDNSMTKVQKQGVKESRGKKVHNKHELLTAVVDGNLTEEQKEGLTFIIEEEKLARDVYITLGKTTNARIFSNIAKSEQQHMDAVKTLLSKYNVQAPLTLDTIGDFENEELQSLYIELIEKGKLSIVDAFEVGVLVEETDIADLKELLESGVPSDFERVYNNLLNGSYKHLDAFNKQLSN